MLRLYKHLGITSLAELEAAAQQDRIKKAKGLGSALQTKILQNLTIAKQGQGRLHLHRAAALLRRATEMLKKARPDLKQVTIAGDFRRGCELISDLALVAEGPTLNEKPELGGSAGLTVHVSDRKHFGATLLQATGSHDHLDQLRRLAEKKGMTLERHGLHRGRSLIGENEDDIYRALGLPFIEPELREGRGEIERALQGKLLKLVADVDLRGILHLIRTPLTAPRRWRAWLGRPGSWGSIISAWRTIPRSAHYAGGLSLEQIKEQHQEADRLNKSFGKDFQILKGIESDILADGSLDYPNDILDSFDFVVASIHGRFKLDRKVADRAPAPGNFEPAHDDPWTHDG